MKFEFSPHIAFQVKDYDNAISFYRDVIGMEVVSSSPKETHMKCGPMNFYIENSDGGFTFFEFRVDSVARAEELLESKGCRVTHTYSDKSKMFADPYGMRFHIWEE
jgi:catechol 2,3-dioxygenase-like lactoylglutathione lyase family enzyme